MSFRNDGSCRIDDSGIPENFRAHPRFQSTLGNQVNPSTGKRGQLLDQGFELDQTNAHSRLELHHDVDVTFRTRRAADRGPEQRELLNTVSAAYLGERLAVDMRVTELESLVHGLDFIMSHSGHNRREAFQKEA